MSSYLIKDAVSVYAALSSVKAPSASSLGLLAADVQKLVAKLSELPSLLSIDQQRLLEDVVPHVRATLQTCKQLADRHSKLGASKPDQSEVKAVSGRLQHEIKQLKAVQVAAQTAGAEGGQVSAPLRAERLEAQGVARQKEVLDPIELSIRQLQRMTSTDFKLDEERVLWEDRSGVLYEGEWNLVSETVAVKKLRCAPVSREERRQFHYELALLYQLRGAPNVVSMLGACLEEGREAIVLRRMAGGNLSTLLHDTDHPLPWPERVRIAYELVSSINYLHLQQPPYGPILHRDIKSSSFFLDGNGVVHVSDLSLSRIKTGESYKTITKEELVIGTPQWTSPEQMQPGARRHFNAKCDVYSIGIVLWEIATRQEPWGRVQTQEQIDYIRRAVQEGLRPPMPADVAVPDYFVEWMTWCWQQNAYDRPTCQQLKDSIKRQLQNDNAASAAQSQQAMSPRAAESNTASLPRREHKEWDGDTKQQQQMDGDQGDALRHSLRPADVIDLSIQQMLKIPWSDLKIDQSAPAESGCFGVVRRGSWLTRNGLPVAIKSLKLNRGLWSRKDEIGFKYELALMYQLRERPNIVSMYGVCLEEGREAIIMKLMTGGTLFQRLRRHDAAPLAPLQKVRMALEVVRSINHLHLHPQGPILHRDIKSLNFLLDEQERVYVSDFGLSRVRTLTDTHRFDSGPAIVGSLFWTAPEQLESGTRSRYSDKCDIFSIGVVLWELATGMIPWNGLSRDKVMEQVKQTRQGPPIPDSVPAYFKQWIQACWAEPDKRPSCSRLVVDVEAQLHRMTEDNGDEAVRRRVMELALEGTSDTEIYSSADSQT